MARFHHSITLGISEHIQLLPWVLTCSVVGSAGGPLPARSLRGKGIRRLALSNSVTMIGNQAANHMNLKLSGLAKKSARQILIFRQAYCPCNGGLNGESNDANASSWYSVLLLVSEAPNRSRFFVAYTPLPEPVTTGRTSPVGLQQGLWDRAFLTSSMQKLAVTPPFDPAVQPVHR